MEYFAHTNISLNIDVLYAFKTYRGKGGYSGYIPSPKRMEGDCWMWDIPLNLRYISTGISSYMMLREKYNLTYKPTVDINMKAKLMLRIAIVII